MSDRDETKPAEGAEQPAEGTAAYHHLIEGRLEKMRELGRSVELYPYAYERTHTSAQVREQEAALTEAGAVVRVPGRIMTKRGTGKTIFAPVQDEWGRIQAYFQSRLWNSLRPFLSWNHTKVRSR